MAEWPNCSMIIVRSRTKMNFRCPVCFFDQLPYPPERSHICPCCGTEFGNDDVEYGYDELRHRWIIGGAVWFFGQPPQDWNAWAQLAKAAYGIQTEAAAPPNRLNIRSAREPELQFA